MKNDNKATALDKMLNGTLEDYILYLKNIASNK
jgi:hypothetical protein